MYQQINGQNGNASHRIIEEMRTSLHNSVGESADLLLPELAAMFLDDAPTLIRELDSALAAGDAIRVRELAHALKGSSISMGLLHFSQLCDEIEQQAKTADLTHIDTKVKNLEAAFEQIAVTLETVVK